MKGNDFPALPGVPAATIETRKISESADGATPWESSNRFSTFSNFFLKIFPMLKSHTFWACQKAFKKDSGGKGSVTRNDAYC